MIAPGRLGTTAPEERTLRGKLIPLQGGCHKQDEPNGISRS